MNLKLYDIQYDKVIKSFYLTTGVDYEYAIEKFVPLINKLEFQRNPLRASFYKRLEEDIQIGCIMPNITVAIKDLKNDEEINLSIDNTQDIKILTISNNDIKSTLLLTDVKRVNNIDYEENGNIYTLKIDYNRFNKSIETDTNFYLQYLENRKKL